ncbi:MAG: T9SS type A sorting domain-containing protein [Bacteroidetes bacterium]|nr:T9SS type A sorting domain-containing protein [Bacteroidota bacterium]
MQRFSILIVLFIAGFLASSAQTTCPDTVSVNHTNETTWGACDGTIMLGISGGNDSVKLKVTAGADTILILYFEYDTAITIENLCPSTYFYFITCVENGDDTCTGTPCSGGGASGASGTVSVGAGQSTLSVSCGAGLTSPDQCPPWYYSGTVSASGNAPPFEYQVNGSGWTTSITFSGEVSFGPSELIDVSAKDASGRISHGSCLVNAGVDFRFFQITPVNSCIDAPNGSVRIDFVSMFGGWLINTTVRITGPDGDKYKYNVGNQCVFTNLHPGSYHFSYTEYCNGGGWQLGDDFTIGVWPEIQYSIVKAKPTCPASDNGQISINASAGVPPFQFSIDNGTSYQSSSIFSSLDTGVYHVKIKDTKNCIVEETVLLDTGHPNTSSYYPVASCFQYSSPSGNHIWTSSGTYTDTIPNAAGCDSVITIDLTILNSSASSISETVCDGYLSPSGNYTWTVSGTYNDTIPNVGGCDSIITIILTIEDTSSAYISESACAVLTSPSGNYIWTSSGTYADTIPNAAGCDSIITIDLIILSPSSANISETACDEYISPSGNHIWTSSGTYSDTISNVVGCDSVITIDLHVFQVQYSSITETVCDTYVSPSGNYIWHYSGQFQDTIQTQGGCDSIITIDLTVENSATSLFHETACESYISPDGSQTWTTSGIYRDTLTRTNGCDSIIVIDLEVLHHSLSSFSETICDSMTSPSGDFVWTSSGMFTDTIANAGGCDSVITFDLTLLHSSDNLIKETVCDSFVSPSTNYTWYQTGIYYDTLQNSAGCDSIITCQITINSSHSTELYDTTCSEYISPGGSHIWNSSGTYQDTTTDPNGCNVYYTVYLTKTEIDTAVFISGDTLFAQDTNAVYQWYNCTEDSIVTGQTGQWFRPAASGSYAVVLTNGECSDTSSCHSFVVTGIVTTTFQQAFRVYPNPATTDVFVEFPTPQEKLEIILFDQQQRMISAKTFTNEKMVMVSLPDANAIYYLRVRNISSGETAIVKVIRKY